MNTPSTDNRSACRASAVLHLKLFNPLNDHYGMSPLEAAQRPIDTHNAAAAWNKAMLDNAARPSGALVYAAGDGQLTAEQFERLKAELERSYQGAANAGRPMVLEGGLDWKEMGFSPKDMEFIEAKNGAAREIALAFGVPPMLLGIPGDNTFANYAEANRSFWRQTVLPLASRVAEAMTGPASAAGCGWRMTSTRSRRCRRTARRCGRASAQASFLTDDEKRAAVGYGAKANARIANGKSANAGVRPSIRHSPTSAIRPKGNSAHANPPGRMSRLGRPLCACSGSGRVRGLCQPVRRARRVGRRGDARRLRRAR